MHKAFFPLFLLSLAGVLATSWLQHAEGIIQWISLAAGLFPLAAYHVILFRKHILSPTEVDSIYYFGFLVTVITLVSTAISIGLSNKPVELRWVLLQFGLGLVATGYALFARLHLLAKSSMEAEVDVVASSQKLVMSIEKVTGEFDRAGYQVAAFVDQTDKRLAEMQQRSHSQFAASEAKFEEKLNRALIAFNEILAKSLGDSLERCASTITEATSQFSISISSLMEEIGRIQTEAHAISFRIASERIEKFSTDMVTAINSISASVSEASNQNASAISELVSTARKSQRLASDIASKLESLNRLTTLVETISTVSESLSGISKTVVSTDDALSSLAAKASQAEEGIRKEIIAPLGSSRLATILQVAESEIPDTTRKLAESLSFLGLQATAIASMLNEKRESLEKSMTSATTGLGSVEQRLAPLDELGASARMAISQLRSTTVALQTANRMIPLPATPPSLAASSAPSTSRPDNIGS